MIYLLDTSIVSHAIRGDRPQLARRLSSAAADSLVISVLTEVELRYGLAKRGEPAGLKLRINKFLGLIVILPWSRDIVSAYVALRIRREAAGAPLSPMDMLIAAHASAIGATLVSSDAAFAVFPAGLKLEDWTK
ncbi:PIN domain-containing protein [Duganella sp. Dugasp56]|uniref:PIN domain-containing protein n=1 Tax=Duganella sp. Dugasp56 TaxID=3243046 RepID=UPI0039AFEE23